MDYRLARELDAVAGESKYRRLAGHLDLLYAASGTQAEVWGDRHRAQGLGGTRRRRRCRAGAGAAGARQQPCSSVCARRLPFSALQQRSKVEQCSCCRGSGDKECDWCHGTGAMTLGDTLYCSEGGCTPCPVCRGTVRPCGLPFVLGSRDAVLPACCSYTRAGHQGRYRELRVQPASNPARCLLPLAGRLQVRELPRHRAARQLAAALVSGGRLSCGAPARRRACSASLHTDPCTCLQSVVPSPPRPRAGPCISERRVSPSAPPKPAPAHPSLPYLR